MVGRQLKCQIVSMSLKKKQILFWIVAIPYAVVVLCFGFVRFIISEPIVYACHVLYKLFRVFEQWCFDISVDEGFIDYIKPKDIFKADYYD